MNGKSMLWIIYSLSRVIGMNRYSIKVIVGINMIVGMNMIVGIGMIVGIQAMIKKCRKTIR